MTPLEFAQKYNELGFSVIPLEARKKTPLPSFRLEDYFKKQALKEEITVWFSNAERNIGIITGTISRLLVLDIDGEEAKHRIDSIIPKLSENLQSAIANTMAAHTGKGLHLFFRYDPSEFSEPFRSKKLWIGEGDHSEVMIKGEGGYVVAAPSIHPDTGEPYTLANDNIPILLTRKELNELANALDTHREIKRSKSSQATETFEENRLTPEKIQKLLDHVLPLYTRGKRDAFVMSMAGYLRKSGVSLENAEQLISIIAKKTGDEEQLSRLIVVRRTYDKPVDDIVGYTGLLDLLTSQFEDYRALEILSDIQDIIKPPTSTPHESKSAYQKLIAECHLKKTLGGFVGAVLGEDPPTLVIIDHNDRKIKLVKLVWEEPKEEDDGRRIPGFWMPKVTRVLFDAIPSIGQNEGKPITIKYDPLESKETYSIDFINNLDRHVLFEELTFASLVGEIANSPIALKKKEVHDFIAPLMGELEIAGWIDRKTEIAAEGFFFIGDELVSSKVNVRDVSREQARVALETLEKLRAGFYNSDIEQNRLAHLIKLALIAPFDFARRQRGWSAGSNFLPGVDMAGRPDTGKTYGYGRLFLAMYRLALNESHIKGAGTIGTQPRFIHHSGKSTWPLICDEVDFLTEWKRNDDARGFLEMLKNQRSMTDPRDTLTKDSKLIERPSCSYPILTHNSDAIDEDGFAKRYTSITLTEKDMKDEKRFAAFKTFFDDNAEQYATIGDFAISYILKNSTILAQDWLTISKTILSELYKRAGFSEYPAWLDAVIANDSRGDIAENRRMKIRAVLIDEINRIWAQNRHDFPSTIGELNLKDRLSYLLMYDLIPFAKGHREKGVCLLSNFTETLKTKGGLERVSMKQIADLTGLEYDVVWFDKSTKAVFAKIDDFYDFLVLKEKEPEKKEIVAVIATTLSTGQQETTIPETTTRVNYEQKGILHVNLFKAIAKAIRQFKIADLQAELRKTGKYDAATSYDSIQAAIREGLLVKDKETGLYSLSDKPSVTPA